MIEDIVIVNEKSCSNEGAELPNQKSFGKHF